MSISIFIKSPDTFSERKVDLHMTVDALKTKLTPITGIPPSLQSLSLYPNVEACDAGATHILAVLEEGEKSLGAWGVGEWMVIKVDNLDPNAKAEGEYTDISNVQKFELTKEEYESRPDTVLQNLKSRQLGRFAPAPAASTTSSTHTLHPTQLPGARCAVQSGEGEGGMEKRGTIRWAGKAVAGGFGGKGNGTEEGEWVGVEFDEPVGKNDGSINNHRYFTCPPLHGSFLRPEKVKVGDYPEVDEFADLMDEDEDEV